MSLHFTIYFLNFCTNSVADIKVKSSGVNREHKVKKNKLSENKSPEFKVSFVVFKKKIVLGNIIQILTFNKMTGGQRGA